MFRQENSWPPPLSNEGAEENGVVLALDIRNGSTSRSTGWAGTTTRTMLRSRGTTTWWSFRATTRSRAAPLTIPPGGPNPEVSAPSQSQFYSYIAPDTDALLDDEGHLWAFVSDNPRFDDYYDFVPGSDPVGERTLHPGAEEHRHREERRRVGDDVRRRRVSGAAHERELAEGPPYACRAGIDGPQWVLEYWSQLKNVFDFVRVEDIAYDKRPGMGNVVYVVDSGRATARAGAVLRTGSVDERPRLEDGVRPERPHEGDLALDRGRG